MFKKLRFPLLAIVVLQFAVAPAARAEYDSSLYKSLLKKIYADSELGDAGDIYRIIKKSLEKNTSQGSDLVNKLINTLEDNLDQLAFDVSKEDLRRIKRQLSKYLKRRQANQFVSSPSKGNITPPESAAKGT
jgi:hypothetical protein